MDSIRVKLHQGTVKGCREPFEDGRIFQRFSGIPYAKPPIGELRFRAPRKMNRFETGEIDCTKDQNPSYHKSIFIRDFTGSEDCLYLNVYVPDTKKSLTKFPVMFYIHGGDDY